MVEDQTKIYQYADPLKLPNNNDFDQNIQSIQYIQNQQKWHLRNKICQSP